MKSIEQLFENNRQWAKDCLAKDPDFFSKHVAQQNPEYFWIGCSDSRVPVNQIMGVGPGEVFVHRNVANVTVQSDLSFLAALQFAVDVLQIPHIIVCGHYNCGGVKAALYDERHGLVDNWLRHIQNVSAQNKEELAKLKDKERVNRLSELNAIAQAKNVSRTTVVQDAWQRGQKLEIHSMIYKLHDGLLKKLGAPITSSSE